MNKSIALLMAIIAVMAVPAVIQAQAQTTTVRTTHHFEWRHGYANPFGFGHGRNIVIIPSNVLSSSINNQCPSEAPILLSTGQCITVAQAQYEEQTGQLSASGTVTAFGNTVVGTPIVIGGGNFFHHFHHER